MSETARFMLVDPSGREQSYYSSFSPRLHHGDAEILKVQHLLQKTGCRNVDLTKMAKTAGLEMRTFMRRFKKATNLKPTEYCQRLRIGKAREMLESTNHSVERISWAVGYEDPTSFRRIFHRIMGLSPSDYRSRFAVKVT
jgi:transcriptional regulator GlxA family with amidase domain